MHLRWVSCVLLLVVASAEELDSKFDIEILKKPDSPVACQKKSEAGDRLTVQYTGTLQSTGEKFDSSLDRKEPFKFTLGMAEVVKGWELGLGDMCIGEKRRLTVPPMYAYGDKEVGKIPPSSTLIFEVELLNIEAGNNPETIFNDMDRNADGRLDRDEVHMYMRKMGHVLDEVGMQMEKAEEANQLLDKLMRLHDNNEDGYITIDELIKPRGRDRERRREAEEWRQAEAEAEEEGGREKKQEDEEVIIEEDKTTGTEEGQRTEL